MANELVKFIKASIGYVVGRQKIEIVKDLDLTLEKGEILLLEGENGSGKTTVIKALIGKAYIFKGDVKYAGKISYLAQESPIFGDSRASIKEIIKTGVPDQWRSGETSSKVKEVLETVGLPDFEKRTYDELSGGQKQRVLLARALICSPDILILDEPANHVDKDTIQNIGKIIESFVALHKTGVIITTHIKGWIKESKAVEIPTLERSL